MHSQNLQLPASLAWQRSMLARRLCRRDGVESEDPAYRIPAIALWTPSIFAPRSVRLWLRLCQGFRGEDGSLRRFRHCSSQTQSRIRVKEVAGRPSGRRIRRRNVQESIMRERVLGKTLINYRRYFPVRTVIRAIGSRGQNRILTAREHAIGECEIVHANDIGTTDVQ